MPNQPRVFISYARSDGETFATDLRARLEAKEPEITLWQDRARMEGGKDWWRQITEALDAVQFMVLVMTPAALESPMVRKEWQYARQRGVCVYPVVADEALDFAAMPRWMSHAHFYHLDKEWQTFVNYLKSPCNAARVPFMAPELPHGFVPRPGQLDPLLDALLESGRLNPTPGTAAFYGPGGFGKTTLAAAVCHNDDIITTYDAGLLWVTLGEKPNLLNELVKLYAALTGRRPGFVDEQDAARALAERLAEGSYLLVIDDVWRPAHLRPFLLGGPNCARLVTTRHFDLAATLQTRISVDEMSSDEAVAMLTARLPAPPPDRRPFRRLASRLGEWPLLLELARDVLHLRMAQGATLEEALAHLESAFARRGVTAFDRRDDDARNAAVGRSLQVSLDQLEKNEQIRYPQLAIFPDDVSIPLTVLAALWGIDSFDCEELVTRLAALSLLYYDLPYRSIRLHDMIRAYLAGQLADPAALHARLLDAWGDLHTLPNAYAWRWAGYHLAAAGRGEALRRLLFDYDWLQAKLNATDANALAADCVRLPGMAPVQRLGQALRQAGHILAEDPGQLVGQLWGRLADDEDGEVQALLAQARAQAPRPYLRPLTASLRESGALIRTLQGHKESVYGVAVTRDGRLAISASGDKTLKVWDLASGAEVRILPGHKESVNGVAVTPDGRLAISASEDKTLKVWDLATGAEVRPLPGHTGAVRGVAVTSDSRTAISASDDDTLKVWDLATGDLLRTLQSRTKGVNGVAVTPNDLQAISASEDGTLKVWDLASGNQVRNLPGHTGAVRGVAVTPDGRLAISASDDKTLKVWDLATETEMHTLRGHTESVYGVAVTSDNRTAISASADQTLKVWDLATGDILRTWSGHTHSVYSVAVALEDRQVISASEDRTLKVWDLASGNEVRTLPSHTAGVRGLAVTRDGGLAISASLDKTLKVWDLASGNEVRTLPGHSESVYGVAVTPDSRLAISASGDTTLRVWDLATGDVLRILEGHTGALRGVAVTPDGRTFISTSLDGPLEVWDLATGAKPRILWGHAGAVRGVAVTSDSRTAISASEDEKLKIWDLATGDVLRILEGHKNPIYGVAVTPDDLQAISASADGTLKVWNLASGTEVRNLPGHASAVRGLAVTRDGGLAISASEDKTLKVWKLDTDDCLVTFHAGEALKSCVVAPDGVTIVAGGASGRLHFLRLENV